VLDTNRYVLFTLKGLADKLDDMDKEPVNSI
jgi:hypothetical protein